MVNNGNKIKLLLFKKCAAVVVLSDVLLLTASCGGERVEALTYAVFPYLPDVEYYTEKSASIPI